MRDALRLLLYFIVLSSVIGTMFALALQNHTATRQATRALCALRANYEAQVRDTTDYLKAHPDGAPALGLSRASILVSLNREKDAARSLSDVTCPSG